MKISRDKDNCLILDGTNTIMITNNPACLHLDNANDIFIVNFNIYGNCKSFIWRLKIIKDVVIFLFKY